MYNTKNSPSHIEYLKYMRGRKKQILWTQISIFILFFTSWELLSQFDLIDTFLISSPSNVVKLFLEYIKNGSLLHHTGISLFETIVSFVIGTSSGILIAIGLWWSDFWTRVFDPYLVVLNSLPKTALAPILIIWVGAGYSGIIATAISVSIVVTIINILSAFQRVDEDKIKLLYTFGGSKVQVLTKLVLPHSIPAIISTIKVNIGLSWIGVIVGEFLVSKAGLGWLIVYGGQVFKLDLVMMAVFILAFLSALMYKIISIIENKLVKKSS